METLWDSYGLDRGDPIIIRIAATNYAGTGEWSQNRIGARVRVVPDKMDIPKDITPRIAGRPQRIIELSWEELTQARTGGSVINEYVLYEIAADGNLIRKSNVAGVRTEYVEHHLEAGKTYQFAVTAVNVYGESPLSDTLTIKIEGPPSTLICPDRTIVMPRGIC